MVERNTVGIIYERNENWIGGAYYIQNLVSALCTLDDKEKPSLVIFSKTKEEYEEIFQTGYPYIRYRLLKYEPVKLSLVRKAINKYSLLIKGYIKYPQPLSLDTDGIDYLFPSPIEMKATSTVKMIYWIPDFQELYYPEFFSNETKQYRRQAYHYIANTKDYVVFSSQNAQNDFRKRFPGYTCQTRVIYFAVTHPSLDKVPINEVRGRYGINSGYFISPNQFWKQKKQGVLIEAVLLLKKQGKLDFQLIFTGKESDPRNPDYVSSLKKMVSENNLQDQVKFLGFIDRQEQLQLIKDSIALIQPSLFEGWSTSVEDGKALNKFILASDIPIHREQIKTNCSFFNPHDPAELAESLLKHKVITAVATDYSRNITNYAKDFISLINDERKR